MSVASKRYMPDQKGQRSDQWCDYEDRAIMAAKRGGLAEVAEQLGRTPKAAYMRRSVLLKRARGQGWCPPGPA